MIAKFLPRLRDIVAKANGIGWGYHDYLSDTLETVLPEGKTVKA